METFQVVECRVGDLSLLYFHFLQSMNEKNSEGILLEISKRELLKGIELGRGKNEGGGEKG